MKINITILFLLLISMHSCMNDTSKNVTEKILHIDSFNTIRQLFSGSNILISEQQYIISKNNALLAKGFYKEYFPNGKLKIIGHYLNNKKDSSFTYFSESGKIIQLDYYREGNKNGNQFRYYENGNIKEIDFILMNNVVGFSIYYDINGQITSTDGKPCEVFVQNEKKEYLKKDTLEICTIFATAKSIKTIQYVEIFDSSLTPYYYDTIICNHYELNNDFVNGLFYGMPLNVHFRKFKKGRNIYLSYIELRDSIANNLIIRDTTVLHINVKE